MKTMTPQRASELMDLVTLLPAAWKEHEQPLAVHLAKQGIFVERVPIFPTASRSCWLSGRVHLRGLELTFRQPIPSLAVIGHMKQTGNSRGLRTGLLGLMDFIRHCSHPEAGVEAIAAAADRSTTNVGGMAFERLRKYFHSAILHLQEIDHGDVVWFLGNPSDPRHFEGSRFWHKAMDSLDVSSQ